MVDLEPVGEADRVDELLDAVDVATGEVIATLPRSEIHRRGLWHDVFHCLVVRPGTRSVLLQRRGSTKAAFPGLVDLSVTGHLAAGESPAEGVREADEELGVAIDAAQLVPLGMRLQVADAARGGEGTDRERAHVFLLVDDRPLSDYRPPPGEVASLLDVAIDDLLRMLADRRERIAVTEFTATGGSSSIPLSRDDLVHCDSGYWTFIATMARRWVDGDAPVAV